MCDALQHLPDHNYLSFRLASSNPILIRELKPFLYEDKAALRNAGLETKTRNPSLNITLLFFFLNKLTG